MIAQNKFEVDTKRFGDALRVAASSNMSVHQQMPTTITPAPAPKTRQMQSMSNTLNIGNSLNAPFRQLPMAQSAAARPLFPGANLRGLGGIDVLNGLSGNQTNPAVDSWRGHPMSQHVEHKAKDGPMSPLGATASTTSTASTNLTINTFPAHLSIPNMSIPPLVSQPPKQAQARSMMVNALPCNIGGTEQPMAALLRAVVSTCNAQQTVIQGLRRRIDSLESTIQQMKQQPPRVVITVTISVHAHSVLDLRGFGSNTFCTERGEREW